MNGPLGISFLLCEIVNILVNLPSLQVSEVAQTVQKTIFHLLLTYQIGTLDVNFVLKFSNCSFTILNHLSRKKDGSNISFFMKRKMSWGLNDNLEWIIFKKLIKWFLEYENKRKIILQIWIKFETFSISLFLYKVLILNNNIILLINS